ncbi:DNA gyrase subunit A [Aquiflexum gelatinilyticum]|uniref:DNA gyrase subunit A n=1 Tax=Aquiflexum gelatinilyticum TaxID=2961943 RepID=A0A9X2T0H2_9BACT|nr:DNA gyrase subunit A [Aquiflexum gelatinilyticum]MCR9014901.1 DNA gyrase subunit A [Aquiflexum gelatinilyticum]MCS4434612.1 DNA gyrase subunit A [Aquiflexum gelatinilyticum]
MAQGENENIIPITIEDEMRGAYIDYSMSVIVSRALPDVRDGLKPVHRRILFGMQELGVMHNKPYKKSARIVGEVLGKYHPHGDSAVYETMVRMAQPWSLRYPLVDGQGNFGSVDGDNPAAMRYTEARLKRIAEELLIDINKETVDFQLNFDDSLKEPVVLPAKIPALLLNGTSGIAVGMATNMAPHNLGEVVSGIIAFIDNREISVAELMEYIIAPDFPTGGIIYGYNGVKAAFETGRGRVVVRGKAEIETRDNGRESIIISEIPYLVNKANMIEKTAALINEKKIDGISAIRDESDRQGMRIVYELKRDAISSVVLNNLYKQTQLQTSFSVNNVALVKGRPQTLNLKDMIFHYVNHRHEVVIRRTEYELREAEKRAHILEGYLIALDHLDEVISLIRSSRDPETARNGLMERFSLSEIQARAILDMRLQRLTGMEREKIQDEYNEIMTLIIDLKDILGSEERRMQIIKDELNEIKDRYNDARRTTIEHNAEDFSYEDMIPNEEVIITVSHQGYIKRTALTEYRSQGRGGVGSRGAITKEDDWTEYLFTASTHNYLLIFTDLGKLFWLKTYAIPEGAKATKGRPIQNLINITSEDKIRSIIQVGDLNDIDYITNNYLVMVTKKGIIKKTNLEQYSRPRTNGIIALNIREDDQLLRVDMTNGDSHIIIAAKSGRAVHFHESTVRPMGRTATGVKAITLSDVKDEVVGMVCASREDATLLVVSQKGYGKRSLIEEYRITNRGGKGVKAMNITEKTGYLVAIKEVVDSDDLMIINKSGITIRTPVSELRVMGRATQGVRLIKLSESDEISSVEKITREEEDEVETAPEL